MPTGQNTLRRSRLTAFAVWFACALMVGPSLLAGDLVTLLVSDYLAAQARFELIESARREIDVAYFAIENDEFSLAFLNSLHGAARRGVRVRMIVDGFSNAISMEMQTALLESGVQLREYHRPQFLLPRSITRRLHDKFLCRDRWDMIVGGRNVKNVYFGLDKRESKNYVDVDIRVQGEVVLGASRYFDALWNNRRLHRLTLDNLAQLTPPQWLSSLRRKWIDQSAESSCRALEVRHEAPLFETLEVAPRSIQFLYDPGGEKSEFAGVHAALYKLFRSARRSIIIETPYFVPDRKLDQILRAALKRHVRVIVLTNSLESTDRSIVYPAYRDSVKQYLLMGAEIWEYNGPRILHTKAIVVDGVISAITSFNCDPRSADLDTQNGILVYDSRLAAQVLYAMQLHFASATPAGLGSSKFQFPRLSFPFKGIGDVEIVGPLRLQLLRIASHVVRPHL